MAETESKMLMCDVPHCGNSEIMPENEKYPISWHPKGWGSVFYIGNNVKDLCPDHVAVLKKALGV